MALAPLILVETDLRLPEAFLEFVGAEVLLQCSEEAPEILLGEIPELEALWRAERGPRNGVAIEGARGGEFQLKPLLETLAVALKGATRSDLRLDAARDLEDVGGGYESAQWDRRAPRDDGPVAALGLGALLGCLGAGHLGGVRACASPMIQLSPGSSAAAAAAVHPVGLASVDNTRALRRRGRDEEEKKQRSA